MSFCAILFHFIVFYFPLFTQEDYIYIMDRKIWIEEHVKVWNTDMLPNIGLFLCRGNKKTAKVFELAWDKYKVINKTKSRIKSTIEKREIEER